MKDFGTKFRYFRRLAGISVEDIAIKTGIKKDTISNWDKGRVKSPRKWVEIVIAANAIGLRPDQVSELLESADHLSWIELKIQAKEEIPDDYDEIEARAVASTTEPSENLLSVDTVNSEANDKEKEALHRITAEGVRRIEDTVSNVHEKVSTLVVRSEQDRKRGSSEDDTRLKLSSLFVVKTGREVTATDLLQIRAQSKKGYRPDIYFSRPKVDDEIVKQVSNLNNTIIIGKPLAGKSRAMLHLVNKNFPDAYVFFPHENFSLEQINELILEFDQWQSAPRIFLFNDIDEFVGDPDSQNQLLFIRLLDKILEKEENIIVASCRTSKFDSVNHALRQSAGDFNNTISIPPLTDKERKEIEAVIEKDSNLLIDDTVGSYFYPISEMKKLYDELTYLARENNKKRIRIQLEILRSYKCVVLCQKTSIGKPLLVKEYVGKLIKEYVEKRLINYYGKSHERPLSQYIWDTEVQTLESLGFVNIKDDKLYIDPIYTEKIIAPKDNETSLAQEIVKYYPDTDTYTRLISRVDSIQLCQQLFEQMLAQGIQPDIVTFNARMMRTGSLSEAEEFYTLMREKKIDPNDFTLNIMLMKSRSFENCWELISRLQEFNIRPNHITANILLGKANDITDAQYIIEKLGIGSTEFDVITFNLLMRRVDTYAHAKEILANILRLGLKPNEATFATLMGKAQTFAQGLEIFSYMIETKLQPNEAFINSMLRKKGGTFEAIWEVCEYGLNKNYILDQWSFRRIIDRAEDFSQAMRIYNKLVELGLTPSPTVFTRLVKHTLDYQEAMKIHKLMIKVETKPTKYFYNTIMRKAPSFGEAWSIYEQMENDEIKPDSNTFSNLVKLSDTLKQAKEIFELFIKKGIDPILAVFHDLINKSANFTQAWANYQLMLPYKLVPSPRTLNLLVQKSSTFEDALKVLSLLHNPTIDSSSDDVRYVLHVLVKKAAQLSDVERALDAMDEYAIVPSERTIVLFLEAIGTHRATELVNRLKGKLEKQPLSSPKLQIQNLDSSVDDEELEELFSSYGEVRRALVKPREKLGVVEMQTIEEAEAAREELDFSEFWRLNIKVSEAKSIVVSSR